MIVLQRAPAARDIHRQTVIQVLAPGPGKVMRMDRAAVLLAADVVQVMKVQQVVVSGAVAAAGDKN